MLGLSHAPPCLVPMFLSFCVKDAYLVEGLIKGLILSYHQGTSGLLNWDQGKHKLITWILKVEGRPSQMQPRMSVHKGTFSCIGFSGHLSFCSPSTVVSNVPETFTWSLRANVPVALFACFSTVFPGPGPACDRLSKRTCRIILYYSIFVLQWDLVFSIGPAPRYPKSQIRTEETSLWGMPST